MDINKEKVLELMEVYCGGNYAEFARQLGVDTGHIYRTLKYKNSKAGPKILGALFIFCKQNNLNYDDYIFLNKSLTACNKKDSVSTKPA